MSADGIGGPPRRRPHVGDGERARVGSDDGAPVQHGVQAPEQLVLLLAVFGDGLDHQVAIPESRERPGLADPAQHRVPLLGRGLSLLHTCVKESAHPAHPCLHGLRVRLEHGRLLAAPGAYDGDVRTHRPQTDDAYLINLHGILPSFFMSEARFPAWILAVSDRIFSMKFLRRGAVAHLQSVRTWVLFVGFAPDSCQSGLGGVVEKGLTGRPCFYPKVCRDRSRPVPKRWCGLFVIPVPDPTKAGGFAGIHFDFVFSSILRPYPARRFDRKPGVGRTYMSDISCGP